MFTDFWNNFHAADFSTQVNVVLCILSFTLALFSLVFVIITIYQNQKILKQNIQMIQLTNDTLDQNKKMIEQNAETIENSTRPYITVGFECTQFGTPLGYFMVKNYGSSSGPITKCQYSDSVRDCKTSIANMKMLFDCLNGTTLAPNQKYLVPFRLNEFTEDTAIFDITYTGNRKSYSEHVEIVVSNYAKYTKPRACNKNQPEKDISYATQEIAERLM